MAKEKSIFGFEIKPEGAPEKPSERDKILKESLRSREDLKKQVEQRKKRFTEAMAHAFERTDSGRPGAKIEDYAGIDTEGNERGNFTRDTFAGYLAALEQFDNVTANLEHEKATAIYEKSDSGWPR